MHAQQVWTIPGLLFDRFLVATPKELSRQAFILPYWSEILNIELNLSVS
jgi:hypothetical protein